MRATPTSSPSKQCRATYRLTGMGLKPIVASSETRESPCSSGTLQTKLSWRSSSTMRLCSDGRLSVACGNPDPFIAFAHLSRCFCTGRTPASHPIWASPHFMSSNGRGPRVRQTSRAWTAGCKVRSARLAVRCRGKAGQRWQFLRAMHDFGPLDAKRGPWRQDSRAMHPESPDCTRKWIHKARILPF